MIQLPPALADAAFLALRLMIAAVFFTSGWSHAKDPALRGQSIGMSPGFTLFLGIAEIGGSLGVALGVLSQIAALGLILVMLGAIQKKIFVWHSGFWGKNSSGWHYDLMMIVMNFVVVAAGPGRWALYS
ncbi:MAG TPA: DoxX family protein [Terriglobales bacterium]|jgi:putative oxidoreductase|nr:DoxX family protein [Terriglobales bacterium]